MKPIVCSITLLVSGLAMAFGARAQEVGFVSAVVESVGKPTRTVTVVVAVSGTDGKPLELFGKAYGSFPPPPGGMFARFQAFAWLCGDFPHLSCAPADGSR
jgi:hypothetical protein